MSILAYLDAAAVAQPTGAVPVTVSPTNPLPVTVVAGGGGNTPVVGPEAAGAASATDPVQIAGYDGAAIRRLLTDNTGRLLTVQGQPTLLRAYLATAAAGTTVMVAAPGAGLRHYVTNFIYAASVAGAGGNNSVTMNDGAGQIFLYANGGIAQSFGFGFQYPIPWTVNTPISATTSAATASTIIVFYYTAA